MEAWLEAVPSLSLFCKTIKAELAVDHVGIAIPQKWLFFPLSYRDLNRPPKILIINPTRY